METASKTLLQPAPPRFISQPDSDDLKCDQVDDSEANEDWAYYHKSHAAYAGIGLLVVLGFFIRAQSTSPNFHDADKPLLDIACNTSVFVHQIRGDQNCPEQCPFWAMDVATEQLCDFRCVSGRHCHEINPGSSIADKDGMYCRGCIVAACKICDVSGHDRCQECYQGAFLDEETGMCRSDFKLLWYAIFSMVGIALLFMLCWYFHLCCRPEVNLEGLNEGFSARSLAKLHMPRLEGLGLPSGRGERGLWPLSTNLLKVPVGGAGLLLHLQLQLALMIWAGTLLVVWVLVAHSDPNNFYQGLRPVATPREFCAVLEWGQNEQHLTRRTKVHFIMFAYFTSSGMAVLHSVLQWRRFAHSQRMRVGVNEFTACCVGLPECKGRDPVEENLKDFLEEHTGEEIVGVSVCWDYRGKRTEIAQHTEEVMDGLERLSVVQSSGRTGSIQEEPADGNQKWWAAEADSGMHEEIQMKSSCSVFRMIDDVFLGEEKVTRKPVGEDIKRLLHELVSTDKAYVVFKTEAARNNAINSRPAFNGKRCMFNGKKLWLRSVDYPPDTVLWANASVQQHALLLRFAMAMPVLLLVLLVWAGVFYLPFASWQASFSYGVGLEPGFISETLFSMVVVVGNLIVLFACRAIAHRIGFFNNDTVEAVNMVLYTVAIVLNTFADCYMIAWISYKNQVAMGAHVKGDVFLKDIQNWDEIFTSFAMQKAIGGRFHAMCFPSCFLLPFIMEPLFTILLPRHLSAMVVGRNSHIRGSRAEDALQSFLTMDMGRYADLVLNATLCASILLFASGLWLKTFFAFLASNVYVFVYDHYKVLRVCPGFEYGSNLIDLTANRLLIMPCALLAGIVVFSLFNCDQDWPCLHTGQLLFVCGSAFVGHAILHWCLLAFVTPKLGLSGIEDDTGKLPYSVIAQSAPCTFFSANPVHCLRSSYYYAHQPPCVHFVRGKEHLQRANPDIGAFFEDKPAEVENFSLASMPTSVADMRKASVAFLGRSFNSFGRASTDKGHGRTFHSFGKAPTDKGLSKSRNTRELELATLDEHGKAVSDEKLIYQW